MSRASHTRRHFLQTIGLGAAAMAAPGCLHAPASPARTGKRKPNLLFMPALYWKFAKAKSER